MHVLDRQIVEHLLSKLSLDAKNILDFGCGTGRYWPLLEAASTAQIVGCDASASMLAELRKKHPHAEVCQVGSEKIPFLKNHSIDFILSTLTIGHIPNPGLYFEEWDRVLKPNGYLLITGNHPQALKQGIKRSFSVDGRSYTITNVIHEIEEILTLAGTLGWKKIDLEEQCITEDHHPYFREAGAEGSYRRMIGKPVVYGLLMQKPDPCS